MLKNNFQQRQDECSYLRITEKMENGRSSTR